jgi:aminoglycoside phosphotransferase (APT) family kinase protein
VSAYPPAEAHIDVRLVQALLARQFPALAALPVSLEASGWDNVTFRLGDRLAVRMPRLAVAARLLGKEQQWLHRLAPALPLPVPTPVHAGEPGCGYPWAWSVVPWFTGRSAEHAPPDTREAARFGAFLAALHRPDPPGAPRNEWRGIPLASLADLPERLAVVGAQVAAAAPLVPRLAGLLAAGQATGRDVPETLVHGDLHPKNLVVDAGRIAAVLDWGDLTLGDRRSTSPPPGCSSRRRCTTRCGRRTGRRPPRPWPGPAAGRSSSASRSPRSA